MCAVARSALPELAVARLHVCSLRHLRPHSRTSAHGCPLAARAAGVGAHVRAVGTPEHRWRSRARGRLCGPASRGGRLTERS
eukprot:361893-Chlamydomonas_euryale.AAC.3